MVVHLFQISHREQMTLVAAAALICMTAAYAAIGLADNVVMLTANASPASLAVAAVGLGLGIAVSQYAALMALLPPDALHFGAAWVVLSVAVSIGGAALGLWIAVRWRDRAALSGIVIGLTGTATNYCSLTAIEAPSGGHQHLSLTVFAVLTGVLFSSAAFTIPRTATSARARLASAFLLTLGVFTLCFFGDIASGLQHTVAGRGPANAIAEDWIAMAVVPTALIVLILAFLSNLIGAISGFLRKRRRSWRARRNIWSRHCSTLKTPMRAGPAFLRI